MAKKEGSSPKRSAAPYTPEVTPDETPKPAKKAAKPAAKARKSDQNPPQMAQEVPAAAKPKPKSTKASKPVVAEIKQPEPVPEPIPVTTSMAAVPEIEAPAAAIPELEAVLTSATIVITPISWEMIAERAYLISISGTGGSQDDNWHRAEAELKLETGQA